jgi:hypothetical protein
MRQFRQQRNREIRKRIQPVQAEPRRNDLSSENEPSCQLNGELWIQDGRPRSLKQLCGGVAQAITTKQQGSQIHAQGRVVRHAMNQRFEHLARSIESLRLHQLLGTPAKIPDFLMAIHFKQRVRFSLIY